MQIEDCEANFQKALSPPWLDGRRPESTGLIALRFPPPGIDRPLVRRL